MSGVYLILSHLRKGLYCQSSSASSQQRPLTPKPFTYTRHISCCHGQVFQVLHWDSVRFQKLLSGQFFYHTVGYFKNILPHSVIIGPVLSPLTPGNDITN